jgi:heme/copper-type cytochrome/quinol oxidase subunit 3
VTSAVDATPQWVLRLPMPGWAPPLAAWFTAACFLLLTFKLVGPALVCALLAIAAMLHWGWELDPPADGPPVDIGGGLRLPVYASGPSSQAWWAVVTLMFVAGALYGCLLVSYLYLWMVSPEVWPASAPPLGYAAWTSVLLAASSAAVGLANRGVARNGACGALALAVPLLAGAFALSVLAHRDLSPTDSAYGAIVHAILVVDGFFVAAAIALALFALARRAAGRLDRLRRVTFDNARLFWHYVVAQTLVGVLLVHGFPRLMD